VCRKACCLYCIAVIQYKLGLQVPLCPWQGMITRDFPTVSQCHSAKKGHESRHQALVWSAKLFSCSAQLLSQSAICLSRSAICLSWSSRFEGASSRSRIRLSVSRVSHRLLPQRLAVGLVDRAADAAFERIFSIMEMSPVMKRVKMPSTIWRKSAATLPPEIVRRLCNAAGSSLGDDISGVLSYTIKLIV
jgi:hypothetical protein